MVDTSKGSTRYENYLESYWPCASEISAVNAIGTQLELRDLINSGMKPMADGGLNKEIAAASEIGRNTASRSNRFSPSVENEQADDGTAQPVS